MSNPFYYINAICNHQKVDIENDYNKFLVNRFFSYFIDTMMFAYLVNQFPDMDNENHFNFYFNLVPKKKRFTKWYKSILSDDVNKIAKHFNISIKEAILYKKIITKEYLETL